MQFPLLVLARIQDLTLGGSAAQEAEGASDVLSATGEVVTRDVSIFELLLSGGWYIMLPLAIMSFIAIFIFFERSMAKLKDYLSAGNLDSARNLCEQSGTPIARMLHKGIARIGKPLKDISASIENVGKLEIYSLEKNLSTLATIAGAAPMIGFLGTVIGMVNVFLDMENAGMVRVDDISSGTKQAMITTIVGLIVGIIAYMAYNHLVSRVSKVIHKMEASSLEFIDILEEPAR
ncbi:MAG: MotA/TolQ/ExbB proton channel family protein [Flavobacteriales bacterium]